MNIKIHYFRFIYFIILQAFIAGCSTSEPSTSDETTEAKAQVKLTHISIEPMAENIDLNAVSSFLKKSSIKSTAAGVVESAEINLGDYVKQGDILFIVKTKEAVALEKALPNDTSFNFKGDIRIRASKNGIVSSLTHHKGDYVQEGEEMAVIAEQSSLVFQLEVPFELHPYIKTGQLCNIVFSDNTQIKGMISSSLPIMDIQSQTENYIIKPTTTEKLPENLIVKVKIAKSSKSDAVTLPKGAVLANETQTEFWVMKLMNDSTAVKILIKKGIESTDKVEILEPVFKNTDRILLTGNYGLPDTAKIAVQK